MATTTVTSYKDNPNGTTTNYTADGGSDTGYYSKNKDGSFDFNVITSDLLNPSTKPLTLPTASPYTSADGFQESLTAGNKSILAEADRDREARKQALGEKSQNLDVLMRSILEGNKDIAKAPGTIDRTEENDARKAVDEYASQLEAEQLSNRRRLERLREKNPEGLFGGALEDEIYRLNSKSLSKQADLAILQNSSLRRYDTAKAIADKALEMKLEPMKANLENLKFFYQENKADFNREDARLYQEAINKEEREYNRQQEVGSYLSELKTTAVKNGLTDMSVLNRLSEIDISDPKAKDKALALVGKYAADPLERAIKLATLSKLNKEISLLGEPTKKEREEAAAALTEAKASIPAMEDKINAVSILSQHDGLNQRVGSNFLTRNPTGFSGGVGRAASIVGIPSLLLATQDLSGSGQDFAGGVHKLVNGMTLENLIAAKARGATFGALSDGELRLLASSASTINDWEIKDKKGVGQGVWDIDEASFKRELDNIRTLTQRAIYLQQGKLFDADEQSAIDSLWSAENMELDPSQFFTTSVINQ